MSDELKGRKEAAIIAADEAFWAKIVEAFPEATSGDFPPDAHIAWQTAMENAVEVWVNGNVPGAAEEEDDDSTCPWCTEKVRPQTPTVIVTRGYLEDGEIQVHNVGADEFYHGQCWDTMMEHTKSEEELE